MVHSSITAFIKALSLTIEDTAKNNLLEKRPLDLRLNLGVSLYLKDISFMQNHIVA